MPTTPPSLPRGSLILVTGFTGYIGAHVTKSLLDAGFNVRGTARNAFKAEPLTKHFHALFGVDRLQVVSVPDIAAEGAFSEALRDVAGVIHVASVTSLSKDPSEVIAPTISANVGLLKSAVATPSVKRFVLTGSIVVGGPSYASELTHISETDWNDSAVEKAWTLSQDTPLFEWVVYTASKVEGERQSRKFVEENKPAFGFSVVAPGLVTGPLVDPNVAANSSWTGARVLAILRNQEEPRSSVSLVDVRDVAALHVAALLSPKADNRRLYAVDGSYSWQDVADTWRRLRPNAMVKEGPWSTQGSNMIYDKAIAEELLRDFTGHGFRSLEDMLASYPEDA